VPCPVERTQRRAPHPPLRRSSLPHDDRPVAVLGLGQRTEAAASEVFSEPEKAPPLPAAAPDLGLGSRDLVLALGTRPAVVQHLVAGRWPTAGGLDEAAGATAALGADAEKLATRRPLLDRVLARCALDVGRRGELLPMDEGWGTGVCVLSARATLADGFRQERGAREETAADFATRVATLPLPARQRFGHQALVLQVDAK